MNKKKYRSASGKHFIRAVIPKECYKNGYKKKQKTLDIF